MVERQKRLLQDMMKFTKNSDGLASISAPITTGTSSSGKMTGSNNSSIKEKNQNSSNQTPKKSTNSSDVHFSGSAFLSSPDPSALPMPNFDGENEISYETIEETKSINTSSKSSKIMKKSKETNEKKVQIKQPQQQQQEAPVVDKTNILKKFLKLRKT